MLGQHAIRQQARLESLDRLSQSHIKLLVVARRTKYGLGLQSSSNDMIYGSALTVAWWPSQLRLPFRLVPLRIDGTVRDLFIYRQNVLANSLKQIFPHVRSIAQYEISIDIRDQPTAGL